MASNKKPIKACLATTFGTNFYGLHIPKGSVYVKLPEQVVKGKFYPATYAWVEELSMARKQQHFYVMVLTAQDKRPRRVYMDGERGYARILKDYIAAMPADKLQVERHGGLRKDILPQAPKDRKVPEPIQRMRNSYFTNPHVITDIDSGLGALVVP